MLKHPMAQRIEHWLLEKLIPWARNPRTHSDAQVAQIAASIAEFGFNSPILVDSKAGIIAGHGRLLAARKLGLNEVPVIVLDHLTEAQKRAYIIADNQLALSAGWDEELLRLELAALQQEDFDLSLIGFEDEELARLLAAQDAVEGLTDEDAAPEIPKTPLSRAGDLWHMGDHRVLCGDATRLADVQLLMAGEQADMIFMDPPYGCDLAATQNIPSRYRTDAAVISNDDLDVAALTAFLRAAFSNALSVTREGAVWYVTAPHGPIGLAFSQTLSDLGVWRHSLVWVKDSLVMGRMDYHYRHEPIYYGWSPGGSHHIVPTRDQDTVWEIPRPKRSTEHPTMKPVALIERALANSSDAGDLCLDPFCGSGSTLIACHKISRIARMMELEPRYIDVAVTRWQEFSGQEAVLHGDGRTFAEIAAERRKESA
jgi:DNA modification methylase